MTELVPLRNLLEVQNGFAFASENFVKEEDGLPLIRIRDLGTRNTQVKYKGTYRDEFVVTRGDLLIGMDGDFECHRWDGPDALLNQRVCRLRNFAAGLDQSYLFHWIGRSLQKIHATTSFVTVKHISSKQILDLEIPLPPLDEQRRIVGLLDRAAKIRRRADAARAKARAIIPALFLDMFGDPATNPKGWPIVELGDVISRITGGKNIEAGNGTSKYRIMKVSAVTSGIFKAHEAKPAPDDHIPAQDHHVRAGDFLFSRANTSELVGAVAIADDVPAGLLLPDKIWRIEWTPTRIEPRYAYSLLRSSEIRRIFAVIGSGTSGSMKNISQAKLVRVPIPLPPLPIQTAFAEQTHRLDSLARHLDAAAAKAEAMAAGLSAEVFG